MTAEYYIGLPYECQKAFRFSLIPDKAEFITKKVFDKLGVDFSERVTHSRIRHSVEARQISMYLLSLKTKSSLKEIGKYFGGRDHSTVIHSKQTVEDLMYSSKYFKTVVEELLAELNNDTVEA